METKQLVSTSPRRQGFPSALVRRHSASADRAERAGRGRFRCRSRDRRGETFFHEAPTMGTMVERIRREPTDGDIQRIAGTYPAWRGDKGADKYEDVPGFCKSATLEEIRKQGHVLTAGRYVGAEAVEEDGEPFEEKMKRLAATLREQQAEAATLDKAIATNMEALGYGR